ncbi:LytR/AlgR family response regulator transcription factor [Desulforamulus aeronauticus]|uniref:Stage 0 sporulation protein A homolog n=1 Tax=Desulforamulus aeronauticus DSM 10349 TaxID=1121421 RepID=A0A1M6WQZ6_9FIRM|nr:LytTR family DNA-binding domain-containing protein [Desulforamulus aeronauticus]SHK96064.1 two component transcriptional regulator, LytTR family [Desulforamulus aeronauticus DSM 10349]
MITVLIAEDDPSMRHILNKTLSQIPGVKVVGEAADGLTALTMVENLKPRVVFIDIDLPQKNGLDLAREICDINPQTILVFATAYDDYTQEAFEVYAFDYLVKPYKLGRIKKTMERIKQLELRRTPLANYLHPNAIGDGTSSRIVVRQNERLLFLDTKEMLFITKEDRKTVIYFPKQQISIMENLEDIEKRLPNSIFFRSHRSYIVNLALIKKIFPYGRKGYEIAFAESKETALLTSERFKALEKRLKLVIS